MIFQNYQANPNLILKMGNYQPYNNGNNKNFDDFSRRILDLKNKKNTGIDYFYNRLAPNLADNFTIVTIPSHSTENKTSGIEILAKKLCTKNITDGTKILKRTSTIQKLAHGGNRSYNIQYQTIEVTADVKNKIILLIDDVKTTGNSMIAAKNKLLQAGAKQVYTLALAHTICSPLLWGGAGGGVFS
jgi:predicted amidophosphoribosyltransferase